MYVVVNDQVVYFSVVFDDNGGDRVHVIMVLV